VIIVPDSGTFIIDFPSPSTNKTMQYYTSATFNIINAETQMPLTACVEKYPTQGECFQSGNLHEFIKPRVFVVQSQYDEWGIGQVLQYRCLSNAKPANMDKCNDTEQAFIEQYRSRINQAVANLTSVERNGAWSVACIQHGFLENFNCVDNGNYRIPTTSGTEITDALVAFMKGGKRNYIDLTSWPNNLGCNGRDKENYLLT
jgi:hypothetical protein